MRIYTQDGRKYDQNDIPYTNLNPWLYKCASKYLATSLQESDIPAVS